MPFDEASSLPSVGAQESEGPSPPCPEKFRLCSFFPRKVAQPPQGLCSHNKNHDLLSLSDIADSSATNCSKTITS